MTKTQRFLEIIQIIQTCGGSFSTMDVEADVSPQIESKGNLHHSIETFNSEGVEVEVWMVNEQDSIDSYTLGWDELSAETIKEIHPLALTWKEIFESNNDN